MPSDNRDLNYDNYFEKGKIEKAKIEEFTSDSTKQLNVEEVKETLLGLKYIQEELGLWEA